MDSNGCAEQEPGYTSQVEIYGILNRFLDKASPIRDLLGKDSALFDRYIWQLIAVLSVKLGITLCVGCRDAFVDLFALCGQLSRGEVPDKEEKTYKLLEKHVAVSPDSWAAAENRSAFCMSALMGEVLRQEDEMCFILAHTLLGEGAEPLSAMFLQLYSKPAIQELFLAFNQDFGRTFMPYTFDKSNQRRFDDSYLDRLKHRLPHCGRTEFRQLLVLHRESLARPLAAIGGNGF